MPVINQRNCQPCTACCEGWLHVRTPVATAHLGKACAHCVNHGCNIYSTRPPEPCQSFHCAWRQEGSLLPYQMRPDLSGVIVMTDQLQWQDEDVIVAVATGPRIPARTFHWLCSLAQLTSRQLVAVEHKQDADGFSGELNLRMVGPDAFREVMATYFEKQGFVGTTMSMAPRVVEHAAAF